MLLQLHTRKREAIRDLNVYKRQKWSLGINMEASSLYMSLWGTKSRQLARLIKPHGVIATIISNQKNVSSKKPADKKKTVNLNDKS